FFSSRRRHTRFSRDWSSDVCSSDLVQGIVDGELAGRRVLRFPSQRQQRIVGEILNEIFRFWRLKYLEVLNEKFHCRCWRRRQDRSEERRVGKECTVWCV